jgi:transcription elongation factor GreA
MKKKIKLTKEGLQALKDELHELKTVKLPSILERLKRARAMGDLRENSEYSASKEDQAMADGRIFELEMLIKNSEIIDVASDSNIVHLGCSVDVERDGTKETYYIVGEYEADPMNKKLSEISPIGKALIGKKVGQEVEVAVPVGKMIFKIVDIKA